MVCYPEFKAGQAEVSRIERVTDLGPGDEFYVRLPDGYLIACGPRKEGEKRADTIAQLVNVLMRWEGSWPPLGNVEAIIERNFEELKDIKEMRKAQRRDRGLPSTEDVKGIIP